MARAAVALLLATSTAFQLPSARARRCPVRLRQSVDGVDARDASGETPLIKAAEAGDCTAVVDLLRRGADPNAQSYTQWTALHGAAENGCVDCIRALLDAGARPDAKAKSGLTPAEIARKYGRDAAVAVLSQTPLEAFPVALPETGGTIIITPCPGKRKRDLGTDLDHVKRMGAEAVITMVQDHELDMLAVRDMGAQCQARGLTWLHCPIADFDGPGAAFENAWADGAGARARDILRRGGTVVSHCRGGIGRAGTVASRLLIELGAATPDEALRRVRKARPGAVETLEQENHVLSCSAVVD
jgi:protein-tyrosine phosphatase